MKDESQITIERFNGLSCSSAFGCPSRNCRNELTAGHTSGTLRCVVYFLKNAPRILKEQLPGALFFTPLLLTSSLPRAINTFQ
jgi:hypothetical protein